MVKIGKKKKCNGCNGWKKESLLSSMRKTLTLWESLLIMTGIKSSSLGAVTQPEEVRAMTKKEKHEQNESIASYRHY